MAIDEALMTYADPVVGGRKTFPFIVAAVVGVGIGAYATLANSGIYLMEKYNVSPVDGSVIASVFVGSTNLAPVVGGVISDTCLSCFAVISVACAACFLGMLLFTLTAIFPSLRPPSCTYSPCQGPTTWQFAILSMALALMTVGLGGTRFTGAAMGAAQFGDENDRDTFFSWYLVAMYISSIIGIVGIVYIQANLGWVLGFGVCAVIAAVGFVIFLLGNRYYRHPKPQENPLVDIFRQILSRAGKRKAASESSERLLCCSKVDDGAVEPQTTIECPRARGNMPSMVHSIDIHPSRKHICVAGGSGGTIFAWDLRWQQQPIILSGAGVSGTSQSLSESDVWEVQYDNHTLSSSVTSAPSTKILPVMMCSEDGILAVLEQDAEPIELLGEPCAINTFDIDPQNPSEVICALEWESIGILTRPRMVAY
ncbi:putative protein NRT1/ PTR FAMILY 2.2 isoform X4 [Asparagus officinalis]|uniref:putative protein NRT1/ PTR FAMILY 2.2 isoform X4 n=1 Tax=Asparagus officinalis TaxID=4686 RepID=UPI00098E306A|nr:putative protein NRT1/ PTR FAMILY 2.2 isoform X4 [Asparagus officinalis]